MNYYNEVDSKAAEWLRTLIFYDLIAYGDVDTRSIEDVTPSDLKGYTQCHFFAGIGVWSYALRLAGWGDNRPVWTGSCPCQPFSTAGKGGGADDERHLWPAWYHLIQHAKPREVPIFGEQVASPAALAWLDLVCADMEGENHSVRAVDLCAAGVGAPHIRQRLWWVADAVGLANNNNTRRLEHAEPHGEPQSGCEAAALGDDVGGCGGSGGMAHGASDEQSGSGSGRVHCEEAAHAARFSGSDGAAGRGGDGLLADSSSTRLEVLGEQSSRSQRATAERGGAPSKLGYASSSRGGRDAGTVPGAEGGIERQVRSQSDVALAASELGHSDRTTATRQRPHSGQVVSVDEAEGPRVSSAWSNVEWIYCRDNKWRPVEPGTFPLAHGAPARVGRLRGFGNAIVAPLAAEFIKAYMTEDV